MKTKCMMIMLCSMSIALYASQKSENKEIAKVPFATKSLINLSSRSELGYAVRRQVDGGCWYAIYDEHDQKGVGEYLVSHLDTWFKNLVGDSIEAKMKTAFIHANNLKDFGPAGSSVAVVYIKDGYAHIAHVGDCRIVVCQKGQTTQTEDHTAFNKKEVQRIQDLNIEGVEIKDNLYIDSQRYTKCYSQTKNNGRSFTLTHTTRSIGDHNTHQNAIIPEPEYMSVKLDDPEGAIVIGSFGFWNGLQEKIDANALKNYVHNFENNKYNNSAFMVIKLGREFDPYHLTKRLAWRGVQIVSLVGVFGLLCYKYLFNK